jgi:hypothetical protein
LCCGEFDGFELEVRGEAAVVGAFGDDFVAVEVVEGVVAGECGAEAAEGDVGFGEAVEVGVGLEGLGGELDFDVDEGAFPEFGAEDGPVGLDDGFDEEEFGGGGGLELEDEGVADAAIIGVGFGGKEGRFGASEAVGDGVAGGAAEAI